MFSKIAFVAALAVGANAGVVARDFDSYGAPAYGAAEEPKSYNSTSAPAAPVYGGEKTSSTEGHPYTPTTTPEAPYYGGSSTTEKEATYPATYPASSESTTCTESSSTEYKPTYPATYSSSSTEYKPTYPASYSSSSSSSAVYYPTPYGSVSSSYPVGTGSYSKTEGSPVTSSKSGYTTATITKTKEITITSCAPEVTDCPAKKTPYVTTTEEVYTTYCPEEEASKYSSSAYVKPTPYESKPVYGYPSKSETPYAPISTGTPEKPTGYGCHGEGCSTSYMVTNKTLTYTQGYGTSATVITTTVKSTSTLYLTSTVYATKPAATESKSVPVYGQPSESKPVYGQPSESKNTPYSPEKTTTGYVTIQSTSTLTNYVTVYPVKSTEGSGHGATPVTNAGYGKPSETCVANTVTVTEKETVYVTVPVAKPTESGKSVGPIQSSSSVYYPTAPAYPTSSGVAKPTTMQTYYKPSESKSTPYSPEKSSSSKPVYGYPSQSSKSEEKPYPSSSSSVYYPTAPVYSSTTPAATYPATYPTAPAYSSSTKSEEKPYSYPSSSSTKSEEKPYTYAPETSSTKKPEVSTAYVTPVPSKPAGYGGEAPPAYAPAPAAY